MIESKIFADLIGNTASLAALPWEPYGADERRNVEIVRLYDTRADTPSGPAAALLKYKPGARVSRHLHPGYELIFVLEGVLNNDAGAHPAGTLEVCPPGSTHQLWSDTGSIFLVVWEQPVVVQKTRSAARTPALAD
jgi:anti-sigma factor ChrR (cupin superfamily)